MLHSFDYIHKKTPFSLPDCLGRHSSSRALLWPPVSASSRSRTSPTMSASSFVSSVLRRFQSFISVLIHQNDIFWTCLQNVDFKVEITPSNVPFPQCREIRTEGVGESKRLDNIIIPASTAIVVCVIVAVIIFVACLKSSNNKSKKLLGKIISIA